MTRRDTESADSRPPERWTVTRRRFVVSALGASGALAFLSYAYRDLLLQRVLNIARRALAVGSRTGTGRLTSEELRTLIAFSDVLIPSALASPTVALDAPSMRDPNHPPGVVRENLEYAAERVPGFWAKSSAAAAFLDQEALAHLGQRFADLPIESRRRTVERLLGPYARASTAWRATYFLTESGRHILRLRRTVASQILIGFYSSVIGWRSVGYSRRPGQCSNLVDYQSPGS